jgi:hypothetical protein
VQVLDHLVELLLGADRIQNGAVIGIDEDQHLAGLGGDGHAGRAVRAGRRAVGGERRAGHGGDGLFHDGRGRQLRAADRDIIAVAEQAGVDLVVEEVEPAGDGKADHEGHGEKAGEEVPSPDGAVEALRERGGFSGGNGRRIGNHGHARVLSGWSFGTRR